ncbi:MAG: hypothetical protein ACYDAC_00630 [Candidatus Dormibacteria bacterium]
MPVEPPRASLSDLAALVARADEDFLGAAAHGAGRHQVDLPEIGLRVSVTRSRYPNRPDGVDQYAVTLTRTRLDTPPADAEVRLVLSAAFASAAPHAVERSGPGALVRMFRLPVYRGAAPASG